MIGQSCEARWPHSAPGPIRYGTFSPAQIVDVRDEEPRYSVEWIGPDAETSLTIGFPARSALLSKDIRLLSNTSYIFAMGPLIEADGTIVFELAERASGTAACSIGMRDSGAADGSSLHAQDGSRQLLDIRIIPKNDPPSFQLLRSEIFLIEDEGLREMRVAHSIFADGVEGFTELEQVLYLHLTCAAWCQGALAISVSYASPTLRLVLNASCLHSHYFSFTPMQELTFTTEVVQNAELFATETLKAGVLRPLCRVDREGRLLLLAADNRYGQAQLSLVLYGACRLWCCGAATRINPFAILCILHEPTVPQLWPLVDTACIGQMTVARLARALIVARRSCCTSSSRRSTMRRPSLCCRRLWYGKALV